MGGFLFCLLAVSGRANTFSFYSANGAATIPSSGTGSDPVAIKVTFITSANQIEVRITNLELNIRTETQAVGAVDFLIAGYTTQPQPTAIALQTDLVADPNLGYAVNFPTSGSATFTTAALTTVTNRWGISNAGTTQLLSGGIQISTYTGGRPGQLIIGAGPYGNVNKALTDSDPHLGTNPDDYISYKLTFAAIAGITANTNIAYGAGLYPRLAFGTTFDTNDEITLTELPEPATVAMMLGGLALIVVGSWRRRRSGV